MQSTLILANRGLRRACSRFFDRGPRIRGGGHGRRSGVGKFANACLCTITGCIRCSGRCSPRRYSGGGRREEREVAEADISELRCSNFV